LIRINLECKHKSNFMLDVILSRANLNYAWKKVSKFKLISEI
jgi:hypothetical protein